MATPADRAGETAPARFAHLFSPLRIGPATVRNRILSTGHGTHLAEDGLAGDNLIAYHAARAKGGAGLIITEIAQVDDRAAYSESAIRVTSDRCIPGYRRLTDAVHEHGATVFGQLFHPGREMLTTFDGSMPVAFAPSAVPNERFHIMPRAMPAAMIRRIVELFAEGAERLGRAGFDGVEIVASHGYLPAQFLSPVTNVRDDDYGGSFDNRLRFVREVLTSVRAAVGDRLALGLRISGDELASQGLDAQTVIDVCAALNRDGVLDYLSVVAGSSAELASSTHIVPPMGSEAAYTAPLAAAVKARVTRPVFVAGRIVSPADAEQVIASGQADMCGMTRALICDPEMPNKTVADRLDDIRVCIGCNQACIGHVLAGHGVSCIQHPETGREVAYGTRRAADARRRILVAGGGPAGMKAAAVAAERGHEVVLCETSDTLGGQVQLAGLLPGRSEFAGLATNLEREMQLAGVRVELGRPVDRSVVEAERPDAVVIATGARVRRPQLDIGETSHVVDAWQVLKGETNVGARVVIADWRCDWVGIGLAELLAQNGSAVTLAVNGTMPGQTIQQYVRDRGIGRILKLGVEIMAWARPFGADESAVYLQNTLNGEPIVVEDVDTLVLAMGHEADTSLEAALADLDIPRHMIGDCLAPRTAEEAVLEGLKVGSAL